MNVKTTAAAESCLQFKADLFPLTVLQISTLDPDKINEELDKAISKAPKYFYNTPIVLDLNGVKTAPVNLTEICEIIRNKKLIPLGIRGVDEKDPRVAACGLALFKNSGSKNKPVEKKTATTKIVTKPVRAGTRVYAKDADLILLSSVNPGGECMADGNIHVYGSLRGRVLAGATGNTETQIFCTNLEAELISIAGVYLINEQFQLPQESYTMLQIYLDQETLKIKAI